MKYYQWNDINEMFNEINQKCNYIVLRNYEEMSNDNFYCSGHADIDFLTDDVFKFVETLKAYPRFVTDDKIHYLVNIAGNEVVLDVRTVGDDYYCKKWERDMLCKRIKKDNWYVNNDVDYYYSLIYHAILQKKEYAKDYQLRLNEMAKIVSSKADSLEEHISNLIKYMKSKDYNFTYPDDIWVPLRIEYIPNSMVKKYYKIVLRRIKSVVISCLVKLKRMIFKIVKIRKG